MSLTATPATALAAINGLQDAMISANVDESTDVPMDHFIHGGIYTRTVWLREGVVLVGALIKVPTTLIISGKTRVFVGGGWIELEGYHIIQALAGRKQVFITHTPTVITMSFRTDADTVEEAEEEFTDETEMLRSRRLTCQER